MKYRIWITYHKDEQIAEYGLQEDATHRLFAAHKVAKGENINQLNPVYSEMVTMWYVWKNNLKSEYVGFEHYRRHFEVNALPKKGECQVYRIVDFLFETVYDQYVRCHSKKDMDDMLEILDEEYGTDNPYRKHICERHWLIANCCFLMRWADFVKMCEFLFPLLEKFAEKCGISNTNVEEWRRKVVKDFGESERTTYHTRVLSFLAERLISAWIDAHLEPYVEGKNLAIVHYNTPELLEAALLSLRKNSPGFHVYIFDNSDSKPFKKKLPNTKIIDNTKRQIIDFNAELKKYPYRIVEDERESNFGSMKHTMSVDKLMDIIPNGFILMDSDVLVKRYLGDLCYDSEACAGSEAIKRDIPLLRPFLCWINCRILRKHGIRYYNGQKMWALSDRLPDRFYDTGAWLLEEVRRHGLSFGRVDISQYILHYGHGSWRGKEEEIKQWLEENRALWE